jgi:hypothetical protein
MHPILVIALINGTRIHIVSHGISMFILIVIEMVIVAMLLHMGRKRARS